MSLMTPLLRLRKVVRSMGASTEQADEFADAMSDYPGRREWQLMLDEMFARWFNRTMLGMILLISLAVAIIVALD